MRRWFVLLFCMLALTGAGHAKPLSQEQFAARFVKLLKSAHPDLSVKIAGPMDLTVKPAEGGEYHVFLGNAYMQYVNAPGQLEKILKVYASQIREFAKHNKDTDKIDRTHIVPIIKDRGWLEETRRSVKAKTGKDTLDNVYEDFNDGLVICYAEDAGQSLRYFTNKALEAAGIPRSGLRALAVANLRRIVPKYEIERLLAVSRITASEGYDASLLLFDDLWAGLAAKNGDIVVAIPTREVLLFTPLADSEGMAKIGDYAAKLRASSAYALTDRLFLYRDGRFEQLN